MLLPLFFAGHPASAQELSSLFMEQRSGFVLAFYASVCSQESAHECVVVDMGRREGELAVGIIDVDDLRAR